jgi:hypothetical protein
MVKMALRKGTDTTYHPKFAPTSALTIEKKNKGKDCS